MIPRHVMPRQSLPFDACTHCGSDNTVTSRESIRCHDCGHVRHIEVVRDVTEQVAHDRRAHAGGMRP